MNDISAKERATEYFKGYCRGKGYKSKESVLNALLEGEIPIGVVERLVLGIGDRLSSPYVNAINHGYNANGTMRSEEACDIIESGMNRYKRDITEKKLASSASKRPTSPFHDWDTDDIIYKITNRTMPEEDIQDMVEDDVYKIPEKARLAIYLSYSSKNIQPRKDSQILSEKLEKIILESLDCEQPGLDLSDSDCEAELVNELMNDHEKMERFARPV